MADAGLANVIRLLRKAVARSGATDRDLLARFAAQEDEAAFTELVARHGVLVLGVCRRLLGHEQDAEDAFQAVFLVLARKAGSVRWDETAGPWLYEVATRTALRARSTALRRRTREKQVEQLPHSAVAAAEPNDGAAVLDEEVSRLAPKYRNAVVLCEIEGRSRTEAARLLGVPEGTLSSRLAAARRMLAERLGRRGVTRWGVAPAVVPPSLAGSTVRTVMLVSAGVEVAAAGPALSLMKGALTTMFLKKLKLAAVAVMVGVLALGGFAYQAEQPAQARAETGAAAPTDLEVLRKEVELLRLRLRVVEAEVRALKGAQKQAKAPEGGKGPSAEKLLAEFAELFKKGRYAEAEALARAALQADPNSVKAREALEMLGRLVRPPAGAGDLRKAQSRREERAMRDWLSARTGSDQQDALARDLEAVLKALREARDEKARREVAEALERAARKLQDHLRKGKGSSRPAGPSE
jgi:RNA polymerase sigma factor (sigma-70 family)